MTTRIATAGTEGSSALPPQSPESKRGHRREIAAIYLSLSFFSGLLELGGVMIAIRLGLPIWSVLIFALAYQVGALCKNPIELSCGQYRSLVAVASVVGIAAQWNTWFLGPAILLLSAGLQGIREEALLLSPVPTLPKRISRIVGFAAAALFTPSVMLALSAFILLLAEMLRRRARRPEDQPRPAPGRSFGALGLVMVLHQMHYFVYAYALPVLFVRTHGLSSVSAGLAFAIGWISYSLAPSFLRRAPTVPVVLLGHVGVTVALALMAWKYDQLALLLTVWFVSGFGGGTVFGIRRLAARWSPLDTTGDLDMWENIGHVLGVLLAISIVLIAPQLDLLLLTAGVLALFVAVTVAITDHIRRANIDAESRSTSAT